MLLRILSLQKTRSYQSRKKREYKVYRPTGTLCNFKLQFKLKYNVRYFVAIEWESKVSGLLSYLLLQITSLSLTPEGLERVGSLCGKRKGEEVEGRSVSLYITHYSNPVGVRYLRDGRHKQILSQVRVLLPIQDAKRLPRPSRDSQGPHRTHLLSFSLTRPDDLR